tara:strand:- start:91 stop:498 length:408 start_codon:yes stop_codon:yes gene_type:complete
MVLKKNTLAGKNNSKLIFVLLLVYFCFVFSSNSQINLEGSFTDIKILDKISSKNTLIKLKNGEIKKFKDLSIKSFKCKNSEFDDDPEVTAYLQIRDLSNKNNDEVFAFNGWMFSSSPSLTPFDHPVYDVWLVSCY